MKLADFGIAKAMNHPASVESQALKGKVPYMAPEYALGRALQRAAPTSSPSASLLYECLAGRSARSTVEHDLRDPRTRATRSARAAIESSSPRRRPRRLIEIGRRRCSNPTRLDGLPTATAAAFLTELELHASHPCSCAASSDDLVLATRWERDSMGATLRRAACGHAPRGRGYSASSETPSGADVASP